MVTLAVVLTCVDYGLVWQFIDVISSVFEYWNTDGWYQYYGLFFNDTLVRVCTL